MTSSPPRKIRPAAVSPLNIHRRALMARLSLLALRPVFTLAKYCQVKNTLQRFSLGHLCVHSVHVVTPSVMVPVSCYSVYSVWINLAIVSAWHLVL
jgi:hypothetical protein